MRIASFLLLFITVTLFAQQRRLLSSELNTNNIQFLTQNLDDIIIETSKTNRLEVVLENDITVPIRIHTKEENNELLVSFIREDEASFETPVFRKYITKRLERARVLVKVPHKKEVCVLGKEVGVFSKSYKGKLSIYIDKGNVHLGEINGDTMVSLFLGNVYADVSLANLKLKTNHGVISINQKEKANNLISSHKNNAFELTVQSIHGNIYLTKQ